MALLAFAVVSSAGVGLALHTGALSIVTPHSGEACGQENNETGEGNETNDDNETAQTVGFHLSGGDGNETGDHNETGHETGDHNETGEHDDKEMCEPNETSDQHEANEAGDNETDD